MSLLYFHDKLLSSKMRASHELRLLKAGVKREKIHYVDMSLRINKIWILKPGTKGVYLRNPAKEDDCYKYLDGLIEKFKVTVIVVQDKIMLNYITRDQRSPHLCRGSVYFYKGIPCIILDEPHQMYSARSGAWVFQNDFLKIGRWFNGKQRYEPRFNYTICRTRADLDRCRAISRDAFIASADVETFNKYISCAGYTLLCHDGSVHSFVIPFINPLKKNSCHWEHEEDEIAAWKLVAEINGSKDIYKVLQNGPYDASYFAIYHCPLVNYFGDTAIAFHSLWPESLKKLNFIVSVVLDFGRYWKDEMKGDKKDAKKSERIPRNERDLERYWRYNALDCYFTLLSWRIVLIFLQIPANSWALNNYIRAFSISVGPAFAKTMRGMKCSRFAMMQKYEMYMDKHRRALHDFRVMCDDFELNPNSDSQVASLLYDVLGAQQLKKRGAKGLGGRSVDKRVLRLIADQSIIFRKFIEKLWEVKEPLNNANKYGNIHLINNRFLYSLGITRTGTERYGSGEHNFHVGTNVQNMPKEVRDMLTADEGYILVELDYSQSDGWFIAYESEEPKMIEVMNDERDTHCIHAEHFFGIEYEKIYEGHQQDAEWTDDPIKGVRQNTKRIVHGANFRMAAYTLYQTMGHKAVIEAARTLGEANVDGWTMARAVDFCGKMLKAYHRLYPGLELNKDNWYSFIVKECVKNGNVATNCHGFSHRFFGDVEKDNAIQRELTAFYGQSGTSGNINNSMLALYYGGTDDGDRAMMLVQSHDALLWQVRFDSLDLIKVIKEKMERKCTIKGRSFVVPVDVKVGYHWGKGMISWRPDMQLSEILETRAKWQQKYLPEGLAAE